MIRALCVVKDEADILGQTLTSALRWCDEILVLDNGSTDGSWELVTALAAEQPKIVPIGRNTQPFFNDIRIELFRARKDAARDGDWWCRLDADEFYVDDPRAFLASVPERDFSVWSASLSYYFTDVDAARYAIDPSSFDDDVPIEEKCRYYINHWSEPRFFRHIPGLSWRVGDGGFPKTLWDRPASTSRILLKHFAYRSPEQIQRRLDARRANPAGHPEFSHEAVVDWADAVAGIRSNRRFVGTPGGFIPGTWTARVVPAAALDFDAHDGTYIVNDDLMPPLPSRSSGVSRMSSRVRTTCRRLLAGTR
jgi:glycosyltransferase involved in cell wall biosynthesis